MTQGRVSLPLFHNELHLLSSGPGCHLGFVECDSQLLIFPQGNFRTPPPGSHGLLQHMGGGQIFFFCTQCSRGSDLWTSPFLKLRNLVNSNFGFTYNTVQYTFSELRQGATLTKICSDNGILGDTMAPCCRISRSEPALARGAATGDIPSPSRNPG